MGFWLFCTVMDLLVPAVMLFFGRRFQTKPPRTINALYGYRTARSMASQEAWDFAHRTCGRLWVRMGAALLALAVLAAVLSFGLGAQGEGIVCGAATIPMVRFTPTARFWRTMLRLAPSWHLWCLHDYSERPQYFG